MKEGHIRTKERDVVQRFFWLTTAIDASFAEIQEVWATQLGISGPQWNILVAVSELGEDEGVPVNVVAKMLFVGPSFITTQSKSLEAKGYMRRTQSSSDRRVVYLSVTSIAQRAFDGVSAQRTAISTFVSQELGEGSTSKLIGGLEALKNCLERVRLKITLDDL